MLIHIVVWKYKNDLPEGDREEHLRMLKELPSKIPNIERFEVGTDILQLDRSYDTGLTSAFADRKALEAYTVHPEHQKVATLGKRIAESVVSVDFITDSN